MLRYSASYTSMVSGAGFRRKANEWAATLQEMVDSPYAFVKQQVVRLNPAVFGLHSR